VIHDPSLSHTGRLKARVARLTSESLGQTDVGSSFNQRHPQLARVQFLKQSDALVYTSGSSLRDDVKGAGYFVFSPAFGPDGKQVVVNRGYVPARAYPAAGGVIEIVGAVRFPEQASWFVSAHDAAGDIWTVRDSVRMARVKGWGAVAPFYIEQESPIPAGGLPHPAPLKVKLRNEHLQYAITWYGLAVVLVVMFAIWARRRGPRQPGLKTGNQ